MSAQGGDPLLGVTVGSFKIVKAIGRGGMGSVYLGEHTVIGSRVAIKVLHDKLAADKDLVGRFYAEARAVNLIGHENIVNIFDMNVVPPHRYYLVMEYLEGKPLNYLLTKPVKASVAIPILVQVCDALAAAHKVGIIHRDLKPENIFLIKRGRTENFVKVLDFGLAKLLDQEAPHQVTAAGLIVGTPEFMSPEQANSTRVDGRSDIYSLGCIAWLLATGKLPFTQKGLTDLLVAHRQMMPPPPHTVNPQVPRGWSDVIMKAIQKRPEDRFQDAAALADALEAVLTGRPQEQVLTTRPPEPDAAAAAAPAPAQAIAPPAAPPPEPAPAPPPAPPRIAPVQSSGSSPRVPPVPATSGSAAVDPQGQRRHAASFDAEVSGLDGTNLGMLTCHDISRGGMFLSTNGQMPVLFSRVKVHIPKAKLNLLAEVVRHVPADQATAWGMSPGFGVQFLDVTPALRDALHALIHGLPEQPAPAAAGSTLDDAQAEKLLAVYRGRIKGDHYEMLALKPAAEFADIRGRAQECQRELEGLRGRPLSPGQQAQLDAALVRVKAANDALIDPQGRAEYDANRQNFLGVGRCIAAGLSTTDLERLRGTFLNSHPGASGSAFVKFLASKAYEAKGQLPQAIEACEAALKLDPLNLQFQQRHGQLLKAKR